MDSRGPSTTRDEDGRTVVAKYRSEEVSVSAPTTFSLEGLELDGLIVHQVARGAPRYDEKAQVRLSPGEAAPDEETLAFLSRQIRRGMTAYARRRGGAAHFVRREVRASPYAAVCLPFRSRRREGGRFRQASSLVTHPAPRGGRLHRAAAPPPHSPRRRANVGAPWRFHASNPCSPPRV